ncbi:MAG: shikimate dehydrogenase [Nitrosomonadales bacterium]|nr:shikimate dehydrogenase [Nitrosomonadales bacterium]
MNEIIKNFAVLGHPISHSLSPKIHQHFADQFKMKINYQRLDIESGNFKEALTNLKLKGYMGLNITLPLKTLAYEACDELSATAKLTKSVNTMSIRNDKLVGDTTDGIGLITDLSAKDVRLENKKILLIGAGGASNGVMYDLISQHPQSIFLTNRTISKSHDMKEYWASFARKKNVLIHILNSDEHITFDLIINATSSSLDGESAVLPENLSGYFWYDMMYGKQTHFLKEAERNKATFSDGLGMLVEQAAASFYIWHNRKPDTKSIYQVL